MNEIEQLWDYFTNNPNPGVTIVNQPDGSFIVKFLPEFDIETVADESIKTICTKYTIKLTPQAQ